MKSARATSIGLLLLAVGAAAPAAMALQEGGGKTASAPGRVIAEDAIQPRIAVAPDGRVHVVLIRKGNIELLTSTDGGRAFGEPVTAIDAGGNAPGGLQRGPRVGVDGKGRVYVSAPLVFDEAEREKRYPAPELFLVRSTDAGRTFGEPVQVNEVPKKAAEGLHEMAVAEDGVVHLAWLDNRRDEAIGLWYARWFVPGEERGRNVHVTTPICECCAPGLVLDGDGAPFLAWRDGGKKQSREIYITASKDGGQSFADPIRVNQTPTRLSSCPMNAPAISLPSGGPDVIVGWMGLGERAEDRVLLWSHVPGRSEPRERGGLGGTKGYRGHPAAAKDWLAWEEEAAGRSEIWLQKVGSSMQPRRLVGKGGESVAFPSIVAGKDGILVVGEASESKTSRVHLWSFGPEDGKR